MSGEVYFQLAPKNGKLKIYNGINKTDFSTSDYKYLLPEYMLKIEAYEPITILGDSNPSGFEKISDELQAMEVASLRRYFLGGEIYIDDIKEDLSIGESFFKRRFDIYSGEDYARHHPVAWFFEGKIMEAVEFRLKVLCKYYSKVLETDQRFIRLKTKLKTNNLFLVMEASITIGPATVTPDFINEHLYDPLKRFDYLFVILSMLIEHYPWKE